MKILFYLVLFLVFSSLLIISNHGLYVFEGDGFKSFQGLYFGWLFNAFSNTLSFTANAIKMDWFPENLTKS